MTPMESEDELMKRLQAGETIEVAGKKIKLSTGDSDDDVSLKANTAEDAVRLMNDVDALGEQGKEALKEFPALREIIGDTTLSSHQKKMAVLPYLRQLRERKVEIDKKIRSSEEKIRRAQAFKVAADQFIEWATKAAPQLEKNDVSRLHKFVSAAKQGRTYLLNGSEMYQGEAFEWDQLNTFVVQHDWAAAFANAGDYTDGHDWNLPFEKCAFEFRISGRNMVVLATQAEGLPITFVPWVEFNDLWLMPSDEADKHPLFALAIAEIKALSVALDSEVAVRNVVRVSQKVNRRRVQEGREPFYSYHVVSLNRRYRVANPSQGGGGTQGKKRLHFRRGHWRHYAEFKTWVRWTLVGNPELGFIDKEYRL